MDDYSIKFKFKTVDPSWPWDWHSIFIVSGLVIVLIWIIVFLICASRGIIRRETPRNREELQLQPMISREAIGISPQVREKIHRFKYLSGCQPPFDTHHCGVCLEKFVEDDDLASLPLCRHTFHSDCIDPHLDRVTTCPYCRQVVSFFNENMP